MNIILLGPPMTGKGTQAQMLCTYFGLGHLSTGQMFRDLFKEKDPLAIKAQEEYIEKGNLVPDEITLELFKKEIKKDKYKNGFILDGFPRTLNQAKELKKIAKIDYVINIESGDELIIRRMVERRTCSKCSYIYGIDVRPKKPGICDKCGGELVKRADDNVETLKHRLKVYREQTKPLEEFYKKEKLLRNIDGERKPEIILEDLKKILE